LKQTGTFISGTFVEQSIEMFKTVCWNCFI